MKKIIIAILSLFSICSHAQLAMEDFEDEWTPLPADVGTAANWLILDNGVGLNFTWVQAEHSLPTPSFEGTPGTYAAYINKENVTNGLLAADYLITPEFTVPEGAQLRFQSRLTAPFDDGGTYKIKILPSASLNEAADINSYVDMYEWASELDLNPIQLNYTEKIVTVPSIYAGTTVRIAFVMEGDNMDRWLVDQVKVVEECENPSGLTAINTTLNSAQLNWVNNSFASNWEIEIITEGAIPTGHGIEYSGALPYTATATATGSPLIQTPFLADTEYRYYVRALCDDTGTSEWIGPFDFKTQGIGDSCQNPIEITSLPFSDIDNTANFGNNYQGQVGVGGCDTGSNTFPYFSGNEVVYQFIPDFTGNIVVDLTDNIPQTGMYIYNECSDIGVSCLEAANSGQAGGSATIDGFPVTAGEDYYLIISSSNGFQATTPYTLVIQQQNCEEPVGLPVSDITTTSASFSWTNPSNASSWELEIQEVGNGIPSGPGEYTASVNTGYDVNDLYAGTNYEYYVRAECGNGTFSAWAGPYLFSTQVCEGGDQCLYTFVMTDTYGYGWVGQTMNVSQNGVVLAVLSGALPGMVVQEVQVPVCDGMPIEVFWNEGPDGYDYTTYMGLEILNASEQVIYTMPVPGVTTGFQGTMLFNSIVDCDSVLCLPPTGLTTMNATMDSVDLSWNGPAAGNWEYYIVESGMPAPGASTAGTATTANPVPDVPLPSPATNYDFYVRMLCEDDTFTSWSGPVTFGSSACPAENKCDYVFTMGSIVIPGWQGGYMTIIQDGTVVANIGQSFISGNSQSVTVSLCNDMPFEVFWSAEGNVGIGVLYTLDIYNSFGQQVFSMPADSGGLLGTTIYTGVNDCDYPLCEPPAELYVSNVTTTTVDLGWEGIAMGNWEYYLVEAGQPAPLDATQGIPTSSNPTIGVAILPATNYEYYVRLVCENNPEGYSSWAGPFPFYSQICEDGDKCLYNFEMLNSEGSGGYWFTSMTISQGGNEVETITMPFTQGYSEIVQVALCPGSTIDIFWNDNPGTDDAFLEDIGLKIYDPYWEEVYFKDFGEGTAGTQLFSGDVTCTPPACPRPLNLSVTEEGLTSATLNWDEMGDATAWTVWVLPLGSPDPVAGEGGIVVGENPYTIETLDPGTPYVWYVMAMCGDDGNSTISFQGSFRTLISNDECFQAIPIEVNESVDCMAFVSGTVDGASYTYDTEDTSSCNNQLGIPGVWYTFVAESAEHFIKETSTNPAITVTVFSGDCGSLTPIKCSNFSTVSHLTDLNVGETYYVLVQYLGPNFGDNLDFTLCIITHDSPVIEVSDAATPEQLVEQMLFRPECGTISNVSIISGSDYGYGNSVGSFNKGASDFTMDEGVVLATGPIEDAVGPFLEGLAHPTTDSWVGDEDLTNIFPDLTSFPSSNASVVEFDFVPSTCHIGFDFLFASDIYGTFFNCESNNGIAVLLTGPMSDPDPATVNIALVPGTNDPVAATTVTTGQTFSFNTCPPMNEEYFDQMNIIDQFNSPINYGGQTVVMQASSPVLQGETYHLKIVIEDKDIHSIGCHDSALFIKGSECISVDLGADLVEGSNSAICYGSSTTLTTNLDPEIFDFRWFKDDIELEGETSETLAVSSELPFGEGTYTVVANYEGSECTVTDSIEVEFYDEIQFTINDISICQSTSGTIAVTPTNFNAADAAYSWTFNGEPLTETAAGISADMAGVYEVTISLHGCTVSGSAIVAVLPLPVADDLQDVLACGSYTLPELNEWNTYFTGTGGTGVELNAGDIIATNQTIFVYAQSATTPICTAESSFTIVITPPVEFNLGGPYIVCADENAEIAIQDANFDITQAGYVWTLNGETLEEAGSSIIAAAFGTYQVTVTSGGCPPVSQSVEVQENTVAITVLTDDYCEDNVFMLQAVDEEGSFDPATATYAWTGPEGFTANAQQFAVPSMGLYTVVVTTPEGCVGIASADILSTACFIQRGISPNSDGDNDYFDLANLDVARIAIFNRYGMEVYAKDNYSNEWYGQADNGDELPTGTYFYMIERRDGEQITGWIYINREF